MNKTVLDKAMYIKLIVLLVFLTLCIQKSFAAEAVKAKSSVLDFEADVIEGERVAPSLFVQMDLGAAKVETPMFQRGNFNDFHALDMKRKPKYRVNRK